MLSDQRGIAFLSCLILHSTLLFSWPEAARAQTPAAKKTSPTSSTSTTATSADVERAQQVIQQAEAKYSAGSWTEALSLFESARQLLEGHPAQHRVAGNIALCQEKLLRIEDAIESYETYRDGLAKDDPERATTNEKIAALKANSSPLRVNVDLGAVATRPPIVWSIDGQPMPEAEEYLLPAGDHVVTMKPQGYDEQSKPVTIKPGEPVTVSFGLIDPYKEAKERVSRAEKLYEAGNYDAALTEFRRAYDTMLGHPARPYVLYNIARCEERLYRYDAAIASYRTYLEIASANEADRPKVEATIESLEGFLGTILVAVKAKAGAQVSQYEVWVDGHLVGENIHQFLIPGGTHQVEIRAVGFERSSKEVQVPARDRAEISFALAPLAKEYRGIPKVYFYTAAGLTVAAGATGAVFGTLTLTKRSAIDQKEPEAVTNEDVDALQRTALYADIFFISAGVLATSATILAFLTDWSDESPPTKDTALSKRRGLADQRGVAIGHWGLAPTRHGGYLSVGGTF